AEGWIRLRLGRPLPEDIVLLEHELAESHYEKTHPGAGYAEAHAYANKRFNWEQVVPKRTGEDLDSWRAFSGDTSGVQEGSGDRTGGGVRVRLPGEGSTPDHQQGGGVFQGG